MSDGATKQSPIPANARVWKCWSCDQSFYIPKDREDPAMCKACTAKQAAIKAAQPRPPERIESPVRQAVPVSPIEVTTVDDEPSNVIADVEQHDSGASGAIGRVLFYFGLIELAAGFVMSTAVGDVNNLGLMNDRLCANVHGGALMIGGAVVWSRSKSGPTAWDRIGITVLLLLPFVPVIIRAVVRSA